MTGRRRRSGFGEVPGASYDETRRSRERSRARDNDGSSGRGDDGLLWIARFLGLVAIVVVAKLLWLQVFTAGDLSAKAESQRTNVITLHAKRGTIYDRNGNVLAVSEECQTIYANPQEVNDPTGAAKLIAKALGGKPEDYLDRVKGDSTFAYVRRQVDQRKAEKLQDQLLEEGIRGIYFLSDTRRVYPYGAVGGQVLGAVGVDGEGLSGLELYYEDLLKGTDGQMIMETGQGGTPIAGAAADVSPAKDGTDIMISLDVNIQQVAEDSLRENVEDYLADSGSVMVTNPQTGEILAACSTPLLDLTDTAHAESAAYTLKPVSSAYEPGSIFKVLTAAIGVDDGLVTADSSWYVPAKVKVGDDYIDDSDDRDYAMDMTLREILRRSSNAGIATVAQNDIGKKRFAKGVAMFQIGTSTGIDYPGEAGGIVKSLEQYDGSTLGTMSYGQGVSVPMVQMVKAMGSIANRGTLRTPHFLVTKGGEEVKWKAAGHTISADSADEIVDMMRTVVDSGTAKSVDVPGYDVAAKTGTGQQVNEATGAYESNKYVSSLIGFANAGDPEVLVYAGLNGTPFHGSACSKLFSAIMVEALSDMGISPES